MSKTNAIKNGLLFEGLNKIRELCALSNPGKKLFKYMKLYTNNDVPRAHGCKIPDDSFVDEKRKIIFIIEKKSQRVGGSVCEKIQTPDFKLWQYQRTFPQFRIVYIYILSDWFRLNCKAELEYLKYKKIPFFWNIEDCIGFIKSK